MSRVVIYGIYQGINLFFTAYYWILLAYVIMSWIMRSYSPWMQFLTKLVSPVRMIFGPIARKLMEKGVMVDLTIILAFVGIRILQSVVSQLFVVFLLR